MSLCHIAAAIGPSLLLSMTLACPAFAQNAPSDAPPSAAAPQGSAPHTIDEIVVTAQKRTQSLQDVPIVVTTINRALLLDMGVKDIKDLTLLTPGLIVTTTGNETSTSARIRGIGTVGDNIG